VRDCFPPVAPSLPRHLSRNSRNSSMPPSVDDLPGRQPTQRERRKASTGFRRGKQPGAPGASMAGPIALPMAISAGQLMIAMCPRGDTTVTYMSVFTGELILEGQR
jgi:hypothetical protein